MSLRHPTSSGRAGAVGPCPAAHDMEPAPSDCAAMALYPGDAQCRGGSRKMATDVDADDDAICCAGDLVSLVGGAMYHGSEFLLY